MRNVAFLAFDITRPFEVAHMCASRSSPAAAARSCTFRPACAPSLSHLVPLPLIHSAYRADSQTPADALLFEHNGGMLSCGQIVTAMRLKEGRPLGGSVHAYERGGITIFVLESMRRTIVEEDWGESEAIRQTRRLRDYMGTLSTVGFLKHTFYLDPTVGVWMHPFLNQEYMLDFVPRLDYGASG